MGWIFDLETIYTIIINFNFEISAELRASVQSKVSRYSIGSALCNAVGCPATLAVRTEICRITPGAQCLRGTGIKRLSSSPFLHPQVTK